VTKAFVDTTILTDAALKSGAPKKAAIAALRRFDESELPVYAIKEFKQGPLRYYAWLHNKAVSTRSFHKTLDAIRSISRQRNRQSTALGALEASFKAMAPRNATQLVGKYGSRATVDAMNVDLLREFTKGAVLRAWSRRRRVTSRVVQELSCYEEAAPYLKRGLLDLTPTDCSKGCCLATALGKFTVEAGQLRRAISPPSKREEINRINALRVIERRPARFDERDCRNLGDAYFTLFVPEGSVILTTNLADHKKLGAVLGRTVEGT
jgi:hypothetical protein